MKRRMTTSNVLATIAVLAALAGTTLVTAAAATRTTAPKLTGAHVTNNSLTSADVKDASLSSTAFSSTTRTQLKAKTGPKGDTGPAGKDGAQGNKGPKGTRGVDAARAYSYITADDTTTFIKPKSSNLVNPPALYPCGSGGTTLPAHLGTSRNCVGTIYPHWAYDCGAVLERYCGIGDVVGAAGSGATALHSNPDGVVGFTGDANGSFVSLMSKTGGNILITGSLTFMRPPDDIHSRVSCQPQVRRSNTADQYTNLGVPTTVSSGDVYELVHISVTGGARFNEPGDYDFQISCRLVDEYHENSSIDDWYFISGNASATTTEM